MTAKSATQRDPVRRWTLIVLGLIVVPFLYSIIADRMTPYTSQATVQTFVVRVASEVAGRVIEVKVADNQRVKAGDVLFRIDPRPFTIALAQVEARMAGVGQTIGASTAAITLPSPAFLLLVVLLFGLLFGAKIAEGGDLAPLYTVGLVTFLIVLGFGLAPLPGDSGSFFITRVINVLIAAIYTIGVASVLRALFRSHRELRNDTECNDPRAA